MKKLALATLIAVTAAAPAMARDVYVRGTVRSDGTYVQPHVRTAPNDTKTDNWSSRPNLNPYTGKHGTVDPYAPPAPPKPRY